MLNDIIPFKRNKNRTDKITKTLNLIIAI